MLRLTLYSAEKTIFPSFIDYLIALHPGLCNIDDLVGNYRFYERIGDMMSGPATGLYRAQWDSNASYLDRDLAALFEQYPDATRVIGDRNGRPSVTLWATDYSGITFTNAWQPIQSGSVDAEEGLGYPNMESELTFGVLPYQEARQLAINCLDMMSGHGMAGRTITIQNSRSRDERITVGKALQLFR